VDGIVSEKQVLFAEAHAYGMPPLDVSHHGGVFTTPPRCRALRLRPFSLTEVHQKLVDALGLLRGVISHGFLQSHGDGRFYFWKLPRGSAAAYISNVVQAATGINLWREWAQLEVGQGSSLTTCRLRTMMFAGVIVSLARQQEPDTSAYTDSESLSHFEISPRRLRAQIFFRKSHRKLLTSYQKRFVSDLPRHANPVPDQPTS